jgi:FkbM family methyltransferase
MGSGGLRGNSGARGRRRNGGEETWYVSRWAGIGTADALMGSLMGRVKRTILDVVSRVGYDVQKDPGSFPPYRLLKRLRLGHDPIWDVRTILGDQVSCVFDIGAHVGQTAARFIAAFPSAQVYSFEPDPCSFAQLRMLADRVTRIDAVNAAVGDIDGEATLFVNNFDQTNSLLKAAPGAQQYLLVRSGLALQSEAKVPVLTLDRFCTDRGIDRIDLLKLDAQGYELRVLDGARGLLDGLAVPLIYVEVCFVRFYEHQPLFPEIYQYLFDRGYRLVWLYDNNFHTHFYSLGANALFIHQSIGERSGRRIGELRP